MTINSAKKYYKEVTERSFMGGGVDDVGCYPLRAVLQFPVALLDSETLSLATLRRTDLDTLDSNTGNTLLGEG